jgi:hypothetical protein
MGANQSVLAKNDFEEFILAFAEPVTSGRPSHSSKLPK